MKAALLLALLALSACGADGRPIVPVAKPGDPPPDGLSMSLSGEIKLGVTAEL